MRRQRLQTGPPTGPMYVMGGYPIKRLTTDRKRQRWPHRIVIWDTETVEREDGAHLFAMACARLYVRQADYTYVPAGEVLAHDAGTFWDAVDAWTRRKESMRLYAANHTFDLGAAEWYRHLWSRLGYQADLGKDFVWLAGDKTPYLTLRRGSRARISFVDTASLHIGSHAQLARDLDMGERPGLDDLEARCRYDVDALAGGVFRYLERLRDLGVRPSDATGTGAGFAVLRTLFLEEASVIHHQDEALYQVEDASRYGGRREGWMHGRIEEPLEEWDYDKAHLTICLEPVPSKPGAMLPSQDAITLQEWLVETEVPCVPYRDPERGMMIYPVGRFPATLWDVEAAAAQDAGARLLPISGGRWWSYEPTTCMVPWAEWCLAEMETSGDPIWRRVLKSWSHQVVGKWGQGMADYVPLPDDDPLARWPVEWQTGPFVVAYPPPDMYDRVLHSDVGAVGIRDNSRPADHANYAIQSYVMAKARVKLWRAMQAAGLENLVVVNTDGLVVTRAGGNRLRKAQIGGLRLKQTYEHGVNVRSAQGMIDLDPDDPIHKISGLPRGAHQTGPLTFVADLWHQSLVGAPVRRPGVITYPEGPLGRTRRPQGLTGAYRVSR